MRGVWLAVILLVLHEVCDCKYVTVTACCKSCKVGEMRWIDLKNLQDHSSGKMVVTSKTEMFSNNVRHRSESVLVLMLSWFSWHWLKH